MPKRYKPSEKMPKDERLIVIKLIGQVPSMGRCYKDDFWPWLIFISCQDDGIEEHKTDAIDWWLDPMEEE